MKTGFLPTLRLFDALEETETLFENLKKRPVIGFFGNSGSGKSTLANAVLGEDVLPAGEASPTQLVILVGHAEYRPPSLSSDVALFGKGFSPHMIHDPDHVSRHLLEQGGGELFGRSSEAHYAVLFCHASICRHLWLMDVPGDVYGPGENCAEKTLGSVEIADGFVFLSTHEGFLRSNDLGLLANIIRSCPPLEISRPMDHILLVRSRFGSAGDDDAEETAGISHSELKRIRRQLYDTAFELLEREDLVVVLPNEKDIAERIQPFSAQSGSISEKTVERINGMAQYLIDDHYRSVEEDVERALNRLNGILHYSIDVSEAIQFSGKSAAQRSEEAKKSISRFQDGEGGSIINRLVELGKSCEAKKRSDLESMRNYFDVLFSEKFLVTLIEENFDDEEDALREVGGHVGQLFGRRLEEVLEKSGMEMSAEIEEMLSQWYRTKPSMRTLNTAPGAEDPGYKVSPSDPRTKFIRALENTPVLGAISFYLRFCVTANAHDSVLNVNTAGYTASLRLLNHSTRANSLVKALGRPVTLGLLLTDAVGSCVRSPGGSWKNHLAAEIARRVREKSIWAETEKIIGSFWRSTEEAVAAGLTGVRRGSDEYMKSLLADLSREYTESELDAYKWSLRRASDFFSPAAPPRIGQSVRLVCIILLACVTALVISHLSLHNHGTFLP